MEELKPWERYRETGLTRTTRWAAAIVTAGLCALLITHIVARLESKGFHAFGAFYTLTITSFVFSRFFLAALYQPPKDSGLEPTIAIVVPSYNEGEAVARTIHSCVNIDYPQDKLEVLVIDDGSTDDTYEWMLKSAAEYPEGRVVCITGPNGGKRVAMAKGIRETTAEILIFVDSDSMPAPWAIRKLVQGFADPKVGAISGLTYVRNAETNTLTRMQAARYYISFQLLKTAESVVGTVSCCSGCFAAYRRSAVNPLLDVWERQLWLGMECTYGDDRSLTNMILRSGYKAIYDAEAEAWTDAPDRYKKFFKQQLRWKKSWAREGPLLAMHAWRTHPIAFPAILIATASGLMSPIVCLVNVVYLPITHDIAPFFYILCLYLMSMTYALMYRSLRSDGIWKYAVLATFFYVSFSLQLVWAIIKIRDGSWGTRPATPGVIETTVEEPVLEPETEPELVLEAV